jgi:hypothetical protein
MLILSDGTLMDSRSLLMMLRGLKAKFCLTTLGIEIFHLLSDNLTCMTSIKFAMKPTVTSLSISNLEEISSNPSHILDKTSKI